MTLRDLLRTCYDDMHVTVYDITRFGDPPMCEEVPARRARHELDASAYEVDYRDGITIEYETQTLVIFVRPTNG